MLEIARLLEAAKGRGMSFMKLGIENYFPKIICDCKLQTDCKRATRRMPNKLSIKTPRDSKNSIKNDIFAKCQNAKIKSRHLFEIFILIDTALRCIMSF